MLFLKWLMLDRNFNVVTLTSAGVADLKADINNTIVKGEVSQKDIKSAISVQALEGTIDHDSSIEASPSIQTLEGNLDKC